MTKRPYFITDKNNIFAEKSCEFKFYTGFSTVQKQKSIESMHEAIKTVERDCNILEISTKSTNPLGVKLSAFNLKLNGYPIECVFQSSKVFSNGKQYSELLYKKPWEIKKDERLRNSGNIVSFVLNDEKWETEPKTMFYDYIYITAVLKNDDLVNEITKYNIFTDIEFNPKRSLNCQARAAAILVSLYKKRVISDYLGNKELFKTIYSAQSNPMQIKINFT